MRELQQILERAGFIAGGGLPINSFNFFAQWGERATAYVQPARGRVALQGWDNADVAFGKDVPQAMISSAEALVRKYYKFRYFASVTVGGRRYWIMTLRRASSVYGFATGGSAPTPPQPTSDEWMWFQMPNGGTVTLNRVGSPTAVTLEVSLDNGATWSEWAEVGTARTQTLSAGQVMHVRNASAAETGFSTAAGSYYHFSLSDTTESGGDLRSLLCKTPSNANGSAHVFRNLFDGETNITKAPNILIDSLGIAACIYIYRNCINLTDGGGIAATTISNNSLRGSFSGCTSLESLPELHYSTAAQDCCRQMAQGASNLKLVKIHATDISASNCIYQWLDGVAASGDFHCPSTLTIPTGVSGIPNGWTRHDI